MTKRFNKIKAVLLAMAVAVVLAGCGGAGGASTELSSDDVVDAFKDAGLTVEDKREMSKDDYGMAPMKAADGTMFTVPFVCEDCNVRVMSFKKDADLNQTKAYYDDLGKESAMFFSWTIEHENILVQLSGDMEEDKVEEYREVVEGL